MLLAARVWKLWFLFLLLFFFLSKIGVAVAPIVISISVSSCFLALSRMGFFSHGSLGKKGWVGFALVLSFGFVFAGL